MSNAGYSIPLIQAPLSRVSGANLVAAVSNAGGRTLGPNSGADSITLDAELTGERMRDQIKKILCALSDFAVTKYTISIPF